MKKLFIILLTVIFVSSSYFAQAADLTQLRKDISQSLISTVNELKAQFKTQDQSNTNTKEDIENLNLVTDTLISHSADDEMNITVLKQGKDRIVPCSNTQELKWKNNGWTCVDPVFVNDCEQAKGETKTTNGECKQKYSYKNTNAGWGSCNNSTGERKTQAACMFTNPETKNSYQVNASNCSDTAADMKKQACGENGGNSSCKCADGLVYKYNNGDPKCMPDRLIEKVSIKRNVAQAYRTLINVNPSTITFYSYRPDTYTCLHDDSTVTFNVDKSRLSAVKLRFFFKRAGWIYINDKLVFGFAGFQRVYKGLGSISGGTFALQGSSYPRYGCDKRNRYHTDALWGVRNHNISLDYFKDGENTIRFHRLWGNTGERDLAYFYFYENGNAGENATEPPVCNI